MILRVIRVKEQLLETCPLLDIEQEIGSVAFLVDRASPTNMAVEHTSWFRLGAVVSEQNKTTYN